MAKSEVLASLKDIHLPEPISWWPLAWGWYGLILIALVLIITIASWYYKNKMNALAKKQALSVLQTYEKEYKNHQDASLMSSQISALLKQVALVYYPRNQVASLHGEQWVEFLNKSSKGLNFTPIKSLLLDLPFKSQKNFNLEPLLLLAALWIKQRGAPCLD